MIPPRVRRRSLMGVGSAAFSAGARFPRHALFLALTLAPAVFAARAQTVDTPVPTVFATRPGQFEVAGPDPAATAAVTTLASEAWRVLSGPLGLPTAFSSPVFVRVVPAEDWTATAAFHAAVEPGGIVSLRLRWEPALEAEIARRALVQALLLRLAVAQHGLSARITVPLWLEQGAVGWWVTRAHPARLDAWQQEAADAAEIPLARLLAWQRGELEPRAWRLASLWWLSHLQDEAGRTSAWRDCLRRVLGGEEVGSALAACYPTVAGDVERRELWWRVGGHHQRRLKALPLHSAAESRAWLGELPRVVLAREALDTVLSLEALFASRGEPAVAAEILRRIARIERELPWVHPLYRNAALSLGAVFEAIQAGDEAKFAEAKAQFVHDANEGSEIDAAMNAALDELEAGRRR